jgi:hypothetical protein
VQSAVAAGQAEFRDRVHAVYDPDSRMLRGFLAGVRGLAPGGEGWLMLSDLAEHLGLRPREQLMGWIAASGLEVRAATTCAPPTRARRCDRPAACRACGRSDLAVAPAQPELR